VGQKVVVGLVAVVVCVLAAGAVLALTGAEPSEEFCNASAVIVSSEPERLDEWTLYVDEPAERRDPCQGDDLWHYVDEDLAEVDGVLFDDCVVSWVDGGRTPAADAGIDCTPKR
jgi:hypothetical protein